MHLESVLITGAGRGLGLEFVRQFRGLQYPPKHVFAACRNPAKAQELKQLAADETSTKIHVIQLDVSDGNSIATARSQVEDILEGAGLNLLLNNAGVNMWTPLAQVTTESFLQELKTNTVAPFMITKAFLPLLQQAAAKATSSELSISRAAVINVSSTLGTFAEEHLTTHGYRVSKCGLNMVSHLLSKDLSPHGILVVAVHPGWVQTAMGGPEAPVDIQTSVNSLLATFAKMSDGDAGKLLNYTGEVILW